MFVWNPGKEAYVFNSGRPKYYCNKCKCVHFFESKAGKDHVEYGQYPDFPFLPGRIIINIPKGTKLQSIEVD